MTLVKLLEAIGRNNLNDVIEALRDSCYVDEYKLATFVYEHTDNKLYKEVITGLKNHMGGKTGCLDLNLTPLMCALIFPSIDKEIIKSLILAGANVDYCPEYYKNLLLFGLDHKCQCYALLELISHGANVNQCDEDGMSPLMHALKNCYDNEMIEKLLLFGADVNSQSCSGKKPLMFVSCSLGVKGLYNLKYYFFCKGVCENRKNVTSLLNYGADVNSRDLEGNSIFHSNICSDLIDFFLSCGGNLEVRNNKGLTPLLLSLYRGNYELFKTFLSLGANPNWHDVYLTLTFCLPAQDIYTTLLIYYGADINIADRYKMPWNDLIFDNAFYLTLVAIIRYSLVTKNEHFIKTLVTNDQCDWLRLYVDKCRYEIDKMKEMFIIDETLSFYDFCVLKKLKNNKFVKLSEKEYELAYRNINSFHHFDDFIRIRLDDNKLEANKFGLISRFHRLSVAPLETNENSVYCYLNYDCLFDICRKHLNFEQIYNLFLASLL